MTDNNLSATESLRRFKTYRDSLLHEDTSTIDHHYSRFLDFCKTDPLVQRILGPLAKEDNVNPEVWWNGATSRPPKTAFPVAPDEELLLRYALLLFVDSDEHSNLVLNLGFAHGHSKFQECVELFRSLIIRPFAEELSHRLAAAANLATPEARAAQAVPYARILAIAAVSTAAY